jgi:hypothetical protein
MADDYANFDQLKYMEGFKLFGEYFHHLWDWF